MVILENDYLWAHESLSRSFFPEALRMVSGEQQERFIWPILGGW